MKLYLSTPDTIQIAEAQIAEAKELIKTNDNLNDMLAPFYNQRESKMVDKVAIIDVRGSLANDATPIHTATGNTDYQDIINEIETATDAGARLIVLKIDSTGGTVSGVRECAAAIKACSVPTVAMVTGYCASGAYWLASSCDEIVSLPSGNIGSVGALCVVQDASKLMEDMGITTHVIINEGASLKGAGYNGYTDEQLENIQNSINKIGAEFKQQVVSNRPNVTDEVFKAGVYDADGALANGLIDYIISDFSEIFDALR